MELAKPACSDLVNREDYVIEAPKPSSFMPDGYELSGERFIPSKHLQLEPPTHIKDMNFKNVPFPFSGEETRVKGNLAYTMPFRVLSDEGVRAAKRSLLENQNLSKSNPRASQFVRGLGYASNFHRGLAYDPTLTGLLDQLARDKVAIHGMTMNISHTNIGQIATGKPVDKWHNDSVDYVMIIILSDLTEMQGGDLRVLQMPDSTGNTFKELTMKGIPDDLVEVVKYTGAGYCVFMQGCKILHTVDAVLAAREPRISLVNSYMSLRPFGPDRARYSTFTAKGFDDRKDIVTVEFSRHRAWRTMGRMKYILEQVPFGANVSDLVDIFEETAQELKQTAALLNEEADDNAKWLDEKKPITVTTKRILSRL